MMSFEDLGLSEPILKAIEDLGFEFPSEIQQQAIPVLLGEKTDIVSLAQTGTGKTAAFGFPMLEKIDAQNKETQGLIIAPTRELCLQITNEMKLYSKYLKDINIVAVYGGASIEEQARKIKKGAHIIVATAGRMQDMIDRRLVDISKISVCVLDEADEMLNMGFYDDIVSILKFTPKDKSVWLFSATMPVEIERIAKEFMNKPMNITVGKKNQGATSVRHEYFVVGSKDRYAALKRLVDSNPDIFAVIFCRTKRDTDTVAEMLVKDGYNASSLHGDLSQNQRDLVMKGFRSGQIQMLVATDVAARGIDVENITHVIHYQLPDDVETYNHRSGRTGRAGKSGISMAIITKSEVKKIRQIEKTIKKEFEAKKLPSGIEICEIQLYHLANNIKNATADEAIEDFLPVINDVLDGVSKEELIKKMVAVEFGRFYNYYKNNNQTIDQREDKSEKTKDYRDDSGETRFYINIGEKDGFTWRSMKDFLKAELNLGRDDIFKVDVKNTFSFFNTNEENTDYVLKFFQNYKLDARAVRVEITSGSGKTKDRKKQGRREGNHFTDDRKNNARQEKRKEHFTRETSKRKRKN